MVWVFFENYWCVGGVVEYCCFLVEVLVEVLVVKFVFVVVWVLEVEIEEVGGGVNFEIV